MGLGDLEVVHWMLEAVECMYIHSPDYHDGYTVVECEVKPVVKLTVNNSRPAFTSHY